MSLNLRTTTAKSNRSDTKMARLSAPRRVPLQRRNFYSQLGNCWERMETDWKSVGTALTPGRKACEASAPNSAAPRSTKHQQQCFSKVVLHNRSTACETTFPRTVDVPPSARAPDCDRDTSPSWRLGVKQFQSSLPELSPSKRSPTRCRKPRQLCADAVELSRNPAKDYAFVRGFAGFTN